MSRPAEKCSHYQVKTINMDTEDTKSGEGQDAEVITPTEGIETHGSPASEGGIAEDLGKE